MKHFSTSCLLTTTKKNYCTFANICNKCYFSRQKTKMKSKISRILLCSHQKQTVVHICTMPHCLKIAKNVSFEFFNNDIFLQFLSCLVTLPDHQLAILTIFGIFNEILSTQKSNVARFARNVE